LSGFVSVWANRITPWGTLPALAAAGLLALAIALLPVTWSLLLVVGGAVVLIILIEPRIGVLLVIPAIPFGSLRQVQVGVANVGPAELLLVLVLAAWMMRLVAAREVRWRWPTLALPLALFLGVVLLSSLSATSLEHSVKEIIKWSEVLVLLVFVANEFDQRWARALVAVLLATGAAVALHGIYQFLFQVGPEEFVLFGRFMRAYGTFEQPNPYGGYLGLTLPLAAGLVAAGVLPAAGRPAGRWWVWVAAGSGLLMSAALIMSWSRGAWLGFGAAVVAMLTAIAARRGRAAVMGLVLVVLVAYVLLATGIGLPPAIMQRFGDFLPYVNLVDVRGVEVTDANFAVLERMAHWQSALAMWTDQPWLGVGAGNYEVAYSQYALPLWPLPLGHAHNYYLNIAAEAGVLGLVSYLVLWAVAFLGAWRAARRTSGWAWAVGLGILGVVVHLSIHNFFDNLYVHGMYLQLGILLGLIPVLARRPDGIAVG
jgi:putative inorganic carbon (hco3(-)) transporter